MGGTQQGHGGDTVGTWQGHGRNTAGTRTEAGQHSLQAGAVAQHAGAVRVLVDLQRDEVGGDGDHQPVPDDSQDANGLQDLQPDPCRRKGR